MDCPKDLIEWVNSDPKIIYYLYDINLLPEVIKTKEQVCVLRGFMFGWIAKEKYIEIMNKEEN